MRPYYFSTDTDDDRFSKLLKKALSTIEDRPLIFLCIGTDKCSGDSLGPLIGYKLSSLLNNSMSNVFVYGTLKEPVHALNLFDTIDVINSSHNNPFILAIDASLGEVSHIGMVTLGTGPLTPGLGVKKDLPKVGDLHITGIVNTHSGNDTLRLQNTRLFTVMKLADFITNGIHYVLSD